MVTALGEKTGFKFSPLAGNSNWLSVDEYVEKPIAIEELVAKIERLCA